MTLTRAQRTQYEQDTWCLVTYNNPFKEYLYAVLKEHGAELRTETIKLASQPVPSIPVPFAVVNKLLRDGKFRGVYMALHKCGDTWHFSGEYTGSPNPMVSRGMWAQFQNPLPRNNMGK